LLSDKEIREIQKELDIKRPYHEVVINLVEKIHKYTDNFINDYNKLVNLSNEIPLNELDSKFIRTLNDLPKDFDSKVMTTIGIDGSNYPIESFGGIFYYPTSSIMVYFPKGILSDPKINTYFSDIIKIDSKKVRNHKSIAELKMLQFETETLGYWTKNPSTDHSIIFIDGPIIDPPEEKDEKYIQLRSTYIKLSFKNSTLNHYIIGVVKKPEKDHVIKSLIYQYPKYKNFIIKFIQDHFFFLIKFHQFRIEHNYFGPLYTKGIRLYHPPMSVEYAKNGVIILSGYFQFSMGSPLRRIELAIPNNDDMSNIEKNHIWDCCIKAVYDWTYEGTNLPLPVLLAHEMATIRKGLAEYLYEEMLRKQFSKNEDLFNIFLSLKEEK